MNTTTPTTTPAPAPAFTPQQIAFHEALTQLSGSERGHRAAVAFRKFLEADERSACGLDSENLRAITALAKACERFGAYNVLKVLPCK